MTKKAQILVSLVKEGSQVPNDKIAKEILGALKKTPQALPWVEKALIVNITDD